MAEIVGARVTYARGAMSKAALGRQLKPFLGRPLARQTVSLIEQGKRQVSPEDLIALARVLDKPVWWFLLPFDFVVFSSGLVMAATDLVPTLNGDKRQARAQEREEVLTAAVGVIDQLTQLARHDPNIRRELLEREGDAWAEQSRSEEEGSGSGTRARRNRSRSARRSTD
jgi:transcriptional regulator with XRE-family HTH domain